MYFLDKSFHKGESKSGKFPEPLVLYFDYIFSELIKISCVLFLSSYHVDINNFAIILLCFFEKLFEYFIDLLGLGFVPVLFAGWKNKITLICMYFDDVSVDFAVLLPSHIISGGNRQVFQDSTALIDHHEQISEDEHDHPHNFVLWQPV